MLTQRCGYFLLALWLPTISAPFFFSQDDANDGWKEIVVFSETFTGTLDDSWFWLREVASRWCIRHDGLEIRVMPGLADTVENALVRTIERGEVGDSFAVEVTITQKSKPEQQYEQAGLTWYVDERPVFKLVKELVDGEIVMIPGRKPVEGETVQLRLEVFGEQYIAKFRSELDKPFEIAAQGGIPRGGKEQISIQCYHGPPDAERWIRFDDFRILKRHRNEISAR